MIHGHYGRPLYASADQFVTSVVLVAVIASGLWTPAEGRRPRRGSELIVLATPLDFMPDNGLLNPSLLLGAKET